MGETSKDEAAEILLSLKKTGHPREFFKDSEFSNSQLDLNLGLSLGGCYSHIPTEKLLSRSSSLTKVVTPDKNEGEFLSLARSSSLQPIEPGQEQRMIKRNEASRRVLDKQRSGWGGSDEKWPPVKAVTPKEVIAQAVQSAVRNAALRRAIMKIKADGKSFAKQKIQGGENSTLNRSRDNIKPVVTSEAMANGKSVKPARTRSVPVGTSEAMANGKSVKPARTRSVPVASSGTMATGKQVRFAETDEQKNPSKKIIVSNAGTDEQENLSKKIRVSHRGMQDNGMKNSGTDEQKNPSKKIRVSHSGMQDNGMKAIMEQMPGVTTTGDGPNGRKIEGFLYKYRKGHVSIVCVCHGNFLSPAEFVKHAGGSDVANPMKHINVLPPSF